MTVLVVLEHHRAGGRGHRRPACRRGRPGEHRPPAGRAADGARPRPRCADPVGERRRGRARARDVAPTCPAFANLMNAKAAELGLTRPHFVRPDGLDAPGEYSTALDVTKLAREAMRCAFIRDTVDETTASIAGGRTLHTWNDLLGVVPGVIGVKTGHTSEAGWSQVAADRRGGRRSTRRSSAARRATQRNADLQRAARLGARPVQRRRRRQTRAHVRRGRAAVRPRRRSRSWPRRRCGGRPRRPSARRSGSSPPARSAAGAARASARPRRGLVGQQAARAARAWSPPGRSRRPGVAGRVGWYASADSAQDIAGLVHCR